MGFENHKYKKIIPYFIWILITASTLSLNAQYAPNFSNLSFYNSNSGKDDLHYDYGWIRNDTNVNLIGGNMNISPKNMNRTLWFQTVALNLSGNDMIGFNHLLSNVGGGGSKTLTIKIIDTFTLVETIVGVVNYTNASQQTANAATVALDSVGAFWIRFIFNHTGDLSSNPNFQVNSFTTTTTPIILPVELSGYNVNLINQNARLNWTTLSETNSSHFEIFRSEDAKNYSNIGQVAAQGESFYEVNYEFYDFDLDERVSDYFYKLVQVDLNGDEYMLGIVRLKQNQSNKATPFVISTVDQSTILVSRQNSLQFRTELLIEIKDLKGNTVHTDLFQSGETNKVISLTQLSSGMYLAGNSDVGFKKFILTK